MGSNNHALSSEKYGEFVRMQYSSHTLLVAVVVNTLFNLFIFPDFDFISANVKYPMFYGITISLRFVAVGMLWTIWANKTEGSILTFGPSKYFQHPWVLKLQSFSVVLMTIILSILVVTNSNFQPHSSGQLYIIICALRVYPVVTSFVLRDTNPIALGISWCLCILTLVVSGLQTQSYDRLADAVSYAFTTGIILYDTYRQNLSMFRLVTKLLETLKENEELAVEAQALELRAMIGNVAHDLKTVQSIYIFCHYSSS